MENKVIVRKPNNGKYHVIKNRDLAITLETLTGQHPKELVDRFKEGAYVWSFINDEKFKEVYEIVMSLLHSNGR